MAKERKKWVLRIDPFLKREKEERVMMIMMKEQFILKFVN